MQVHTLDKATIINELQFGNGINHAVHEGRRADFALILSMFSDDVRDNTLLRRSKPSIPLTNCYAKGLSYNRLNRCALTKAHTRFLPSKPTYFILRVCQAQSSAIT